MKKFFILFFLLAKLSIHAQNCFLNDFEKKNATLPLTAFGTKPTDAVTASITIKADTIGKISKYVFGNAIAVWMGNRTTESGFLNNTKTLAPSLIRFPGGSWSNMFFWNGKPNDIPDSVYDGATAKKTKFYPISGVNDWSTTTANYYTLRQNTGSQGLITINYGYARYGLSENPVAQAAHLAADWVRYDNGRTKFWEIGNENGGSWEAGWMIDTAKNQDNQPQIITGKLYGQHFRVFADSMRAAAAKIGATIYIGAQVLHYDGSTSWNDVDKTWNAGVFSEIGDASDFWVMHNYFGSGTTVDNMLNSAVSEPLKNISFIKQDIVNKQAFSKPVALTEYNMNLTTDNSYIGKSYINGIQATILFNELIKNNFGLAARWLLASGADGMFYQGDDANLLWQARPDFYYAYYQQKFTGDHAIKTTSYNTNILAYASKFASGETGVVIINKGTSQQTIRLNLQNIVIGKNYYIYSLTGGSDNGNFSNYVSVNGITPSGTQWGPRSQLTTIPAQTYRTNGGIILTSPARSVQFIMIDSTMNTADPLTIRESENFGIECYPNPFISSTNLSISNIDDVNNIQIFNILGKEVETIEHSALSNLINIGSKLEANIYMVRINGKNWTKSVKIVKN